MTVGLLSFVSFVSASGLSLRNVINVNGFSFITNDYAYINHFKAGTQIFSAFSSGYQTTPSTWSQLIDSNGYPDDAGATDVWGGSVQIPDPANFGSAAGSYTLDGVGNGVLLVNLTPTGVADATFTTQSLVNCTITFQQSGANGQIQITTTGGAAGWSLQLGISSTQTGPQTMVFRITTTGTGGFFVKNMRFYRTADATDLAAGKVFRTGWKQPLVNLCPSAIRFMNLLGANGDKNCRFENRNLPTQAGFCDGTNYVASPPYAQTSGTNQYTVAASAGTTGNPKTTPASMVHGEIATLRFGNGLARCNNQLGITAVSTASPAQVTTESAHGYSTNDQITHYFYLIDNTGGTLNSSTTVTNINNASIAVGMYVYGPGIPANTTVTAINSGANQITLSNAATISANVNIAFRAMQNLHLQPCKITVTSTTTYTIQTLASVNINGATLGTFSANGTAPVSTQYTTLQVGSGSDRVAYPLLFTDAATPVSFFGNGYLNSLETKTCYFDKNITGKTDGSGNYVLGAWMMAATPGSVTVGHSGDFPIEHCVALINELNAMSPAHTIGMWVNMPVWGLTSMDPDYTTASDWALNAIDVILNPSSTVRAAGYSALGYSGASQVNTPRLIVEYSNENWNGTDQKAWLLVTGRTRWPTISPYQDFQDMQALRSTLIARAIKAANPPGLSRTTFVLGVWGSRGMGNNQLSTNYAVTFAGSVTANPIANGDWYTNDTLVTTGSWGRPIDNHDGVCPATYFDPPDNYYGTLIGTGSFVDDSAMYNGVNNSAATISWTATISGTTMTVTGSPTSTIGVGQLFSGAGVTAGSQVIANAFSGGGFTGTGGAGTYGLNKSSTVASSTTMSNAGGNYSGAANQSQAITNFVAQVVDANNINGSESTTRYATVVMPQFATQVQTAGAGKVVINYEGGTDWQTASGSIGGNSGNSHTLTSGDSAFSIAVINSSQWATAQINFFNAVNAISGCYMPSIYTWIGAVGTERWAYCNPDSYATITGTPTEGAALTVNSPVWIAMGNRNVALPS